MALDVRIRYKDSSRPEYWHPFCFQSTLLKFWWPIAEKHGLETLRRLECLLIEDRAEAEQLVRELRFVENLLKAPDRGGSPNAWPNTCWTASRSCFACSTERLPSGTT
jgi:hypothetical protein